MCIPTMLSFTSPCRSEWVVCLGQALQLTPTGFTTKPGAKEGASFSEEGGRVPERRNAGQECQRVYQRKLGLYDSGPGPGTLPSESQFPP